LFPFKPNKLRRFPAFSGKTLVCFFSSKVDRGFLHSSRGLQVLLRALESASRRGPPCRLLGLATVWRDTRVAHRHVVTICPTGVCRFFSPHLPPFQPGFAPGLDSTRDLRPGFHRRVTPATGRSPFLPHSNKHQGRPCSLAVRNPGSATSGISHSIACSPRPTYGTNP